MQPLIQRRHSQRIAADFRKWCAEVGFKKFDTIDFGCASSAAIASK
jgi:hypothetical protein